MTKKLSLSMVYQLYVGELNSTYQRYRYLPYIYNFLKNADGEGEVRRMKNEEFFFIS